MDDPAPEKIDEVVNYLLRDQDYLMAKEVRHQVEQLNQLLISAHARGMKVEFVTREMTMPDGGKMELADVRVFKKI